MSAKPTLVLMAGLPGAGKTTLASALGRTAGWYVIDKDKKKKELKKLLGKKGWAVKKLWKKKGWADKEASRKAYDWSFEIAQWLIGHGVSVILDSAARDTFILKKAQRIVHSVPNAQLKVILCIADRDLRNQRVLTREDQTTIIRVNPATIAEYFELFQPLLPLDNLTLFTNEPFEKCLSEAENFLSIRTCPKNESKDASVRPEKVYI